MVKKYSVGILLVVTLLVSYLSFPQQKVQFSTDFVKDQTIDQLLTIATLWGILIITIIYNRVVEKENLLIWTEKKYNFKFILKSCIIVYFVSVVSAGIFNFIISELTNEGISTMVGEMATVFRSSYLLLIITCITAAITEEFLMRGYIQPRLSKIYQNPWVGILGTSLIFGVLHSTYGTLGQIVGPFITGIIFSFFYYRYQNITILIIVHFIIDFISLNIDQFAKY